LGLVFRTISFQGNAGAHQDTNGRECVGRSFNIKLLGSGAVHAKQVSCTICDREFMAWEGGLGAEAALPDTIECWAGARGNSNTGFGPPKVSSNRNTKI
jgi:hypothetical protein